MTGLSFSLQIEGFRCLFFSAYIIGQSLSNEAIDWVNIGVPGQFLSAEHFGNPGKSVGILIHLKNMIFRASDYFEYKT